MDPRAIQIERNMWKLLLTFVAVFFSFLLSQSNLVYFLEILTGWIVALLVYLGLRSSKHTKKNLIGDSKSYSSKQQLIYAAVFILPIVFGIMWVVLLTYTNGYLLKHHGVQTFATIENSQLTARKKAGIILYISYDGHKGVLREYLNPLGYADPTYIELMEAVKENKQIPVKYLKLAPSIVASNSQLGLPSPKYQPAQYKLPTWEVPTQPGDNTPSQNH